jgi:hypothetical protein
MEQVVKNGTISLTFVISPSAALFLVVLAAAPMAASSAFRLIILLCGGGNCLFALARPRPLPPFLVVLVLGIEKRIEDLVQSFGADVTLE